VNAKLHPKELAFVIEDSGARFAFVDADWHAALSAAAVGADALRDAVAFGSPAYAAMADGDHELPLEPVATRDAAWLFYTSGTTGRPKGVVITHGNLVAMTLAFLADVLPVAPGDAILHPAPLSHGSGLYVVPHVARGAANVVPESGGFHPEEIAALTRWWRGAARRSSPRRRWSSVWSSRRRSRGLRANTSRASCTAAARCTSPTARRRSRRWARAWYKSTGRASRR
jgi:long-chain acyl-CoA synthetase